ncbi:hypothetical protein OU792_06780 [Algoriphagus sp. NF]|uniref:hypothetical protein n=1 Tax=Algoriphagus sp. NF TaxID=2992756 RepID=UPI00237A4683|nr:hypothetical protein [Algoriphagus sp. NF]MDE0559685.1 hypothetical protein [Algoriphagus sp. NF]
MGLFDFFGFKKANNSKIKEISFLLNNLDKTVLAGCKKGDYVNLWTKPEMDQVFIYAPGTIGGAGKLGIVPAKFFKSIKAHILGKQDFGFSGPLTNNYDATIIDLSLSSCTISIQLFSAEEQKRRINEMIEKDKQSLREELEKKYRMSKPVEIQFELKEKGFSDSEGLKIKVLDKNYYCENPYECKLQLVNDKNVILAETFSQKGKVLRIVKAYFNNQELKIEKIKQFQHYLNVVISPDLN